MTLPSRQACLSSRARPGIHKPHENNLLQRQHGLRVKPAMTKPLNARTEPQRLGQLSNRHLDALEEETIFILREVAASFERPTLLFSGGKDSLVMLKCAEKAFGVGRIPYPL